MFAYIAGIVGICQNQTEHVLHFDFCNDTTPRNLNLYSDSYFLIFVIFLQGEYSKQPLYSSIKYSDNSPDLSNMPLHKIVVTAMYLHKHNTRCHC